MRVQLTDDSPRVPQACASPGCRADRRVPAAGFAFSKAIVVVLAVSPVAAVALVRRPWTVVPLAALLSVGVGTGARVVGARPRDATVLGVLAIPFGVFYLAGMWRGLIAKWQSARVRAAAEPL